MAHRAGSRIGQAVVERILSERAQRANATAKLELVVADISDEDSVATQIGGAIKKAGILRSEHTHHHP